MMMCNGRIGDEGVKFGSSYNPGTGQYFMRPPSIKRGLLPNCSRRSK